MAYAFKDKETAETLKRMARQPVDMRRSRRKATSTPGTTTKVYKAVADSAGGEVEAKKVDVDGEVTGDAETLKSLPGMDVSEDDYLIATVTSDGERAAFSRGEIVLNVYKATTDAAAGEITVKAVNSDGTVTGDEITLKVMP